MTNIFDDLDTDLRVSTPIAAPSTIERKPIDGHLAAHLPAAAQTFETPCPKCNGRGMFFGYSGRAVGQCFKCKGKGKIAFKTSPEERRAAASHRSASLDQKWDAFAASNEAAAAWIVASEGRFEFAAAMREAVRKFGDLTPAQMAAVVKCIAGDAARTAEREAARAVQVVTAKAVSTALDVSKLDQCFAIARQSGAVKAAIRTGSIVFSLAPAGGKNPGAIYCKTRSEGTYLGKIVAGRFAAGFECTPAHTAEIVEAAADPKAAALRYAALTDECSVCGRLLTDPASKAAGIGPVCAAKFGW